MRRYQRTESAAVRHHESPERTAVRRYKMTMIRALLIALIVLVTCFFPAPSSGQEERPRLVCLLIVDQFPARYLERYGDLLSESGLRRMMTEGVWLTDARFSFGATTTAPGHATIATGANPRTHGIVSNSWRNGQRSMYCLDDDSCSGLPPGCLRKGASAKWVMSETLGDAMKRAFGPQAKVWAVSLKDRGAVLPAGHHADGAVWWSTSSGDYVSSTVYFPALPRWVVALNEKRVPDRFFHARWERALPILAYAGCSGDDAPWERTDNVGLSSVLPKVVGEGVDSPGHDFYNALSATPFGNDLVLEAARRVLTAESLGTDTIPDLLSISLTSMDIMGHRFGPDSHEALDLMVRTDRQIGDWLNLLDAAVGLDNCLVIFASDHGVGPMPEYAMQLGLGGGRFSSDSLRAAINQSVGSEMRLDTAVRCVARVALPWISLNDSTATQLGLSMRELAEAVARAACGFGAVDTALVSPLLDSTAAAPRDSLWRIAWEGAYPGRSGEVYVHLKAYWVSGHEGANHGTAHEYDSHVPVMFMGKAVYPRRVMQRSDPRDIVPTVCAVLGIEPPEGATGRVIEECLTGTTRGH